MHTIVLVHGAWMGAWAWEGVASRLRARGRNVVVVELPGHDADATPLDRVDFNAYVAAVEAAVASSEEDVILVGHSMAGMIVTQVAENRSEKIAKLVYLAAYVPKNGEKLLDLALTDAGSYSGRNAKIDEKAGIADIPKEHLRESFIADGSPEALAKLEASYRSEPLAGFVAPVKTSAERWGRAPKVYIHTANDRAVSPELQKRMTAGVTFAKTITLESSHAPFLSRPDDLVSALESV